MQPFLDIWSVLILLGAGQGLFLSWTFFFSPHGLRLRNRLLGLLLFCLTLLVIEILLCYSGYIKFAPFFVGLTEPLTFVAPPLLYLYVRSLTQPAFRWQPRYLWLLGPAGLHAVYMLPFFAQTDAWKLCTVANSFHRAPPAVPAPAHDFWWFATYEQFYPVFYLVLSGYLLLYLGLQLRVLVPYWRRLATQPKGATTERAWLGRLGLGFGLVLLVYVGATTYFHRATGDVNDAGDVWLASLISLLFYGMNGWAISRSNLLTQPVSETETAAEPAEAARRKYEKTALSPEVSAEILGRLRTLMTTAEPYRSPDLSLAELAAQLRVPGYQLSQVINEQCQQNFFDFINSYRIEEVKRQLLRPELAHLKLEEIGFAAGFNSKSAFNAAFKKHTQTTPSQFRKTAFTQ
ncbi:helix-turn-helix domain-containing protein [Hymenobacter chitinivorans]|uniref:Helix-turn-helix protein n=1 Tax=Hymenobacter chitinivorans DSM 11115 TaxID=1121954 RepID=A0A2M9BQM7_9BACT|nr:helix-turn-helix domain-containing protein [Hymenobacter chitinivorans]PJJ60246.1 helix-turn-helix protein [Hymenobacter chitinivorans DSM 11115]